MTAKQIIMFLLMIIIALSHSATYLAKFPIGPGLPKLCIAGQYALHEGQEYKDAVHCKYYMCSRGRMSNELVLTVNTCGSVVPPENCYLKFPPRGTSYPKCCHPKIICKK